MTDLDPFSGDPEIAKRWLDERLAANDPPSDEMLHYVDRTMPDMGIFMPYAVDAIRAWEKRTGRKAPRTRGRFC